MFRWTLRIYIEDTDAGGIVYHANYLKFCERARTEWLLSAGLAQYLQQHDCQFVVRRASIDYRFPTHLGETLCIESRLDWCRQASFALTQTLSREDTVVCTVQVELACLQRDAQQQLRPVRLPDPIRVLLMPPEEP